MVQGSRRLVPWLVGEMAKKRNGEPGRVPARVLAVATGESFRPGRIEQTRWEISSSVHDPKHDQSVSNDAIVNEVTIKRAGQEIDSEIGIVR